MVYHLTAKRRGFFDHTITICLTRQIGLPATLLSSIKLRLIAFQNKMNATGILEQLHKGVNHKANGKLCFYFILFFWVGVHFIGVIVNLLNTFHIDDCHLKATRKLTRLPQQLRDAKRFPPGNIQRQGMRSRCLKNDFCTLWLIVV